MVGCNACSDDLSCTEPICSGNNYYDEANQNCKACDSNCTLCDNMKGCQECSINYYLDS